MTENPQVVATLVRDTAATNSHRFCWSNARTAGTNWLRCYRRRFFPMGVWKMGCPKNLILIIIMFPIMFPIKSSMFMHFYGCDLNFTRALSSIAPKELVAPSTKRRWCAKTWHEGSFCSDGGVQKCHGVNQHRFEKPMVSSGKLSMWVYVCLQKVLYAYYSYVISYTLSVLSPSKSSNARALCPSTSNLSIITSPPL